LGGRVGGREGGRRGGGGLDGANFLLIVKSDEAALQKGSGHIYIMFIHTPCVSTVYSVFSSTTSILNKSQNMMFYIWLAKNNESDV
jgi:hypothetical protein